MPDAPTLSDLLELAERALERTEGEAQATVTWRPGGTTVEITCVIDGRAAQRTARDPGEVERAAKAAALHARRPRAWPSAGLPDPAPSPAAESGPLPDPVPSPAAQSGPLPERPAAPTAPPGFDVHVDLGVARVAIASTRGVRATEQRAHAVATVDATARGRTIRLQQVAVDGAALQVDDLVAEARDLLRDDQDPVEMTAEGLPIVFGPDAVAGILDHLRTAFGVDIDLSGPLHGRLGTRVAATGVHLTDSSQHPATVPRAVDAEGLTRRLVPLIQDGVARQRVHDTASAARAGEPGTGHASRPAALAARADHLVLGGGGADGIEELCAPVRRGLYVAALSSAREADGDAFLHTTYGTLLIEAGTPAAPVRDARIRLEPLTILARVEALARQVRAVPMSGHSPATPATAVVPALLVRA